jgi:molybdenum cofactor synthesis domain-containing protein
MRPFGALLPKEEALARLLAAARPVARAERVPLASAAGRVLAETVHAPFPVPPYARATMDGYAVAAQPRGADASADASGAVAAQPLGALRVQGEVFAGADALPTLAPGSALRIATGAPMPPGADAVVRVEDTSEKDGVVTLRVAPRAGQFVEKAGADLGEGALVAGEGALLTPARLGLLASVGRADALVRAKPRVAIFSSGDELLRPGAPPHPFRIFDANTTTLAAVCEASGAQVTRAHALPDAQEAIANALGHAAALHECVVVSGGASAGAKDVLVDALRAQGEVLFHGVRVKPGKPLLAGRIDEALVVGLPGNPTSALSNACLFLAPALRRMAGLPDARLAATSARLAVDVAGEAERFLFLPVRLEGGVATPTFKGSGALTSMAASDGWIGVPEGARLAAGETVDVHAWW